MTPSDTELLAEVQGLYKSIGVDDIKGKQENATKVVNILKHITTEYEFKSFDVSATISFGTLLNHLQIKGYEGKVGLNKNYLNFFKAKFEEVKRILEGENHYPLRDDFLKKLKQSADLNTKSRKKGGKPAFFAEEFNLDRDDIDEFIVAFPAVLCHFADQSFIKLKTVASLKSYHNPPIETDKKIRLKGHKMLLAHTLSPHSESIALYYELGRYLRFFDIVHHDADVTNERPRIFVTDTDWAKLNRAVTETGSTQIESDLQKCKKFRLALYKKLNIELEPKNGRAYSIGDIPFRFLDPNSPGALSEFVPADFEKDSIFEKAIEYFEYYSYLKEIVNTGLSLSAEATDSHSKYRKEVKKMALKEPTQRPHYLKTLAPILSYSISKEHKNIEIIHAIVDQFSEKHLQTYSNFYYILLQYYGQLIFHNYLKIGVISEEQFDKSFAGLLRLEDVFTLEKSYSLHALYFDHYHFTKKNNQPFTVLPYYFPSGDLSTFENLQEAYNHAIMRFDFQTKEGRDKIEKIINELEISQLAIQFSDLCSFVHYYFELAKADFWVLFLEKIKDVSPEFEMSWREYQVDFHSKLDTFKYSIYYNWDREGSCILPFWFYPFLLAMGCKKEGDKQSDFRKKVAQIFIYVMEQIEQNNQKWGL